MNILDYLDTQTKETLESNNLSNQERIVIAFIHINEKHPTLIFKCSQVAPLIGMDPQYSRGITSMVKSIQKQLPNFPAHILNVNKNKSKLDVGKLQNLLPGLGLPESSEASTEEQD